MNTILIALIATPALEIFLMIKIGQNIGAINTILLIISTAVIGIYFARLQGLLALKSAFSNIYDNKTPIYDLLAGASITIGAVFLIVPGFLTDIVGFILIFPFTRSLLISIFLKGKIHNKSETDTIEADVIDEKKDDL
tara:strand:+ start:283 stop:696 length:414 start_codon:yes stop_codon:yes gene_type:complete